MYVLESKNTIFHINYQTKLDRLLVYAQLPITVKRLHDIDLSGWWYLLFMIPFIGIVFALVICGFMPGTKGENRYGKLWKPWLTAHGSPNPWSRIKNFGGCFISCSKRRRTQVKMNSNAHHPILFLVTITVICLFPITSVSAQHPEVQIIYFQASDEQY